MSISVEDAFADLHNLCAKASHRKYLPSIMLVAVDENDCIVKTEKFKEAPKLEELHAFGADCKGTSIFIGRAENLPTLAEFQQRVMKSGEAIRRRRRGIDNDPETYYPGRGFGTGGDISGK